VADPGLEPGEAGWGGAQRLVDQRKHSIEILIDLVVPEPQDSETFTRKMFIARGVPLRMRIDIVLPTVDLDDVSSRRSRR